MSAGTLALTNNSTTVTGSNTAFTADLAPNDFIVCKIGGTTYTLGVSTIGSATVLTLTQPFTGPTTTGVAWTAVPNQTLVGITTELAANLTSVYRSVLANDMNWNQVYGKTGTITVTLKDGTQYTGPSWRTITDSLATKAASGANSDITSLTGLTTALSIAQGGTGAKTKADAWTQLATYGTTAGTAAQGNDARLNTVDGKTGGSISSGIAVTGNISSSSSISAGVGGATSSQVAAQSTGSSEVNRTGGLISSAILVAGVSRGNLNLYMATSGSTRVGKLDVFSDGSGGKSFQFFQDSGSATCSGSWVNGSDERHKNNIILVPDALLATLSWRGCTYDKKDGGAEVGLIAQDVEKFCPEAITSYGDRTFQDGTVIKDFKYLNVAGAAAAYHTEAIKALFNLVELALVAPEKAIASIDSIKKALSGEASE